HDHQPPHTVKRARRRTLIWKALCQPPKVPCSDEWSIISHSGPCLCRPHSGETHTHTHTHTHYTTHTHTHTHALSSYCNEMAVTRKNPIQFNFIYIAPKHTRHKAEYTTCAPH